MVSCHFDKMDGPEGQSQIEKDKYHVISFICGILKSNSKKSELIDTKNTSGVGGVVG